MTDLTGKVFGQWTVLRPALSEHEGRSSMWVVECSCGEQRIVYAENLRNGNSRSCGCMKHRRLQAHPEVRTKARKLAEKHSQQAVKAYLAGKKPRVEQSDFERWMA